MAKYRKKPVVIEAIQWTGHNVSEIQEFAKGAALWENDLVGRSYGSEWQSTILYINTLEGKMKAKFGDYIIQGVNGEIYPCKPDIFEKTYELVNE